MTDRGMIYVKLGKPDQIETHPSGGTYQRTTREGGGTTSTYPFEVWRYRHVDGIGEDVEIEFVDRSFSGKYEIAPNSWFKDAFTYVQGAGLTMAESLGVARRVDRPAFRAGTVMDDSFARWGGVHSSRDNPFERMQRLVNLEKPPAIRFQDLKGLVTTRVSYQNLPVQGSSGYLLLGGGVALAIINAEIPNAALSYKQKLGIFRNEINLYGSVSTLTNRRVREFEDTLVSEFEPASFPRGQKLSSLYQKVVVLPPGLYRVDLALKDVNSGAVGLAQLRLSVPAGQPEILGMSTLMLARDIRPVAPDSMERLAPFVLGNLKVIPNVTGEYRQQDKLKLMFQIYNTATEQSSSRPMVDLEYLIYAGDRVVKQTIDFNGGLTQSLRGLCTTVVKDLALSDLAPGKYRLVVKGRDTLAGKETQAQADFSVRPF